MLTDQEAMMVAQASFRRGGEVLARERRAGDGRVRPAAAGRFGPTRSPSRCAGRVPPRMSEMTEASLMFLQRRLNPLGVTDDLARQPAPRAGQVAQVLDRLRRHETGADRPWARRSAIKAASLASLFAARRVADGRGVGENQAEVVAQHVRPASNRRPSPPSPHA